MNINQLIKDVHQTSIVLGQNDCSRCTQDITSYNCKKCNESDRFNGFDENLDQLYTKLLCAIDAYRRRSFADINILDIEDCYNMNSFQKLFNDKIKSTFEGALTEFLFVAFDLMGYIIDEFKHVVFLHETIKEELSGSIEEELTYFAVKLEDIKSEHVENSKLLDELAESVFKIFNICKCENIGIKSHIRLQFLYNFSL